MSFEIYPTSKFKKEAKKLAKKHRSLISDLTSLTELLKEKPLEQGDHLGNDCYKIRMAITSKGKGKSGGARVIMHVQIVDEIVFILSIYDKSDQENMPIHQVLAALQQALEEWNEENSTEAEEDSTDTTE